MSRRPAVAFIGPRLRALRLAAGLTQAELAVAASVSRPQIANLEAGRGDPSLNAFVLLARHLNVDPGALLREPACTQCDDAPPAGYACLACGADGSPPSTPDPPNAA